MIEKLAPGEVALIGPCVDGHQPFVRKDASGQSEFGLLVPATCPNHRDAAGYLEMGKTVRPGVREVKRYIPFTAKGPSQVASNAYRSGWDAIFVKPRSEGDGCGPNQAN